MKVYVKEPDQEAYVEKLDTEGNEVRLLEVFNGVVIETEGGEKLAVSMRDGGFEVHYYGEISETERFDQGWFTFNNGYAIRNDNADVAKLPDPAGDTNVAG